MILAFKSTAFCPIFRQTKTNKKTIKSPYPAFPLYTQNCFFFFLSFTTKLFGRLNSFVLILLFILFLEPIPVRSVASITLPNCSYKISDELLTTKYNSQFLAFIWLIYLQPLPLSSLDTFLTCLLDYQHSPGFPYIVRPFIDNFLHSFLAFPALTILESTRAQSLNFLCVFFILFYSFTYIHLPNIIQ